jgi:hypothetical protein
MGMVQKPSNSDFKLLLVCLKETGNLNKKVDKMQWGDSASLPPRQKQNMTSKR